MSCPECEGSRYVECDACDGGEIWVLESGPDGVDDEVCTDCPECYGTGEVLCPECDGKA